MKNDKIIYSISIEDVYEVAQQSFDRNPTKKELKFVEEKIGDSIAWFDIIDDLLMEFEYESKQSNKS